MSGCRAARSECIKRTKVPTIAWHVLYWLSNQYICHQPGTVQYTCTTVYTGWWCTVLYTHTYRLTTESPGPFFFFSCLLVFCIYLFIFFSVPFSSYSYSAYLIFLCSWLLCLFSFALTLCLCMCVPAWPQESRVFAGWLKSSFPSFAISLRSSYLSLQCDRRLPFFCLLLSVFFFSFFFFPLFFSFSFCYSIFINKTESQSERDASQRPKERRVAKIAHLLLMKQSLQPKIFSLFVTSNR